jgi:hypothetical protein
MRSFLWRVRGRVREGDDQTKYLTKRRNKFRLESKRLQRQPIVIYLGNIRILSLMEIRHDMQDAACGPETKEAISDAATEHAVLEREEDSIGSIVRAVP